MASVTFKGGDKGINGNISGIFFLYSHSKHVMTVTPSLEPFCRDSKILVFME